MSTEHARIVAELDRRKRMLVRANALIAKHVETIRTADRHFYDGYPGRACSTMRDARIAIDAEASTSADEQVAA